MMCHQYKMREVLDVATQASQEIERWLLHRRDNGQNNIVTIDNVENIHDYQKIDVDLLINYANRQVLVEIKADRHHTTGNFFFETVSNVEKGTLGCFLYTQADYIFYYFIHIQTLYVLPMPQVRQWFLNNIDNFSQRAVQTPVGGGRHYTTVGRLVPITDVIQEFETQILVYENIRDLQ